MAPHCSTLLLLSALGALGAGCATTSEATQKKEAREREVLEQRVLRLEKRLSDLDARIGLLTERLEQAPPAVGQREIAPGVTMPISPYATRPTGVPQDPRWPAEAHTGPSRDLYAAAPERPVTTAVGISPNPVDIVTDRAAPGGLPPEESLVDESNIDDGSPPLVITMGPDDTEPRETRGYRASPKSTSKPKQARAPQKKPKPKPRATPKPKVDIDGLYARAQAARKAGDHRAAIQDFEEILARTKSHHLSDNALYWIGVCHQDAGQPRAAIAVWKKLPVRYPKSAKVPDALYGMAQAHQKVGENDLARTLYAQLLMQYPKAERAADARARLAQLGE